MSLEFVNECYAYGSGSATSISTTPAISHTAGNLLVVFVVWSSETGQVDSIEDLAGNTYTFIRQVFQTGLGIGEIWYAKDIGGHANNIVTVNFDGSYPYREVSVQQWSGAEKTAPYDVSNEGTGDGTSMTTAASLTTVADEVIVAGYCVYNVASFTPGTNFIERRDGSYVGTESRVVNTIGSYGSAMTSSSNDIWMGLHATFKQAVEGEGTLTKRIVALCG